MTVTESSNGDVIAVIGFAAMFPKIMFAISYGFIVLFSILGDYIIELPRCTVIFMYLVALADTSIHSVHAFLSWTMLWSCKFGRGRSRFGGHADPWLIIRDVLGTAALSAAIDLDHVIMAGSFSIIDIYRLKKRPFFHNTVLMAAISVGLIAFGANNNKQPLSWHCRLGWLLLNATIVHHLRDALRHGFYLYPFPDSPPVPLSIYYLVLLTFPLAMHTAQICLGVDFGYTGKHSGGGNAATNAATAVARGSIV